MDRGLFSVLLHRRALFPRPSSHHVPSFLTWLHLSPPGPPSRSSDQFPPRAPRPPSTHSFATVLLAIPSARPPERDALSRPDCRCPHPRCSLYRLPCCQLLQICQGPCPLILPWDYTHPPTANRVPSRSALSCNAHFSFRRGIPHREVQPRHELAVGVAQRRYARSPP